MKTTWFDNGLLQYQFYVDGKPSPATPVQVNKGYSEVVSELARSLHIGHKGADGMYLSLLTQNNMDDYRSRNSLTVKDLSLSPVTILSILLLLSVWILIMLVVSKMYLQQSLLVEIQHLLMSILWLMGTSISTDLLLVI